MEPYKKLVTFAFLVLVLIASGGDDFTRRSSAQSICNMSGDEMMDCKPAVTPPNPSPPSDACCKALKHADGKCLCSYKNSYVLPTLGIDPSLALQLPKKCNITTPLPC